jgi:hypothetical protein
MKNTILTISFVLLSFISNSQVVTVYLDTTQFFEHSALISTPQAIESGELIYKKLYEHKPNFVVKYDIDRKVECHSGLENQIIEVNTSTNILDVVVQQGKQISLIVLGETEEGGIMYIFEYLEGDVMKGFFSKNPKFEVN